MDFPLGGWALVGAALGAHLLPFALLWACRRLGRTRYEAFLLTGLGLGLATWYWTRDLTLIALALLGNWACYGLGWMRRAQPLPHDRRPWQAAPVGFRIWAWAAAIVYVMALLNLVEADPATCLGLMGFVAIAEGGRNWLAWVMRGGASEPNPYRG